MNRREFLAVATTTATVAASLSFAEDRTAMLPVIDTHQHLWNLNEFKLGWVKPDHPLGKSFLPEDYAAATNGLNVVKSIYMEVDVVPEQQQKEADFVVKLCESGKTSMVAAVISGRPNQESFAKYITPYKGHQFVKGIRQVLHVDGTPKGYCLDPKFIKGIQLLGELGLSFDLCIRPAELPDVAKLVDACPDTRFILDHCGNPSGKFTKEQWDQWRSGMDELARRKNVVSKISGFIANGFEKGKWTAEDLAPAVNGTIHAFGIERVMFGGDWPVCTLAATYKEWLTALRQIIANRPEADQKKILHDNAAKVYGV